MAFYEKQKQKQVTSGYKIKMSGLHHGLLGAPIAIKAMAAKLARLVYRILRYGMKYVDQGALFYEAQHRLSQIKQLKWKAHKLGFQIVQTTAA